MANFIAIIKLIISLLPTLIEAVKAIESALPEGGQGSQKLALVRETMQAAFGVAGDAVASFDQVWPALEKTVGAIVGLFNKTGTFNKVQ